MSLDNFAVFITTHGRPDVPTYRTLRKCGYTGPIRFILDNEDETAEIYRRLYGDQVIVFDKLKYSRFVDVGDNLPGRKAVVYARNACFDIAEDLGLEYFMQVDDDYGQFYYKFAADLTYSEKSIKSLDAVFGAVLEYYKSIDAHCIAFAQNGDFVGGEYSGLANAIKIKRKVMNTFLLSIHRRFEFFGRMNDDVNSYIVHGGRGLLMFTINFVSISQADTQSMSGGMTELYKDSGTYQKSFYSVMYAPACMKISTMGKLKRIHHLTSWDNAVPCIINEKYRAA